MLFTKTTALAPWIALCSALAGCAGPDRDSARQNEVDINNAKPLSEAPDIVRVSTVKMERTEANGLASCSGTIVANNRVLTARHCVIAGEPLRHSVLLNSGVRVGVFAIRTHPTADLAVLSLADDVSRVSAQAIAPIHVGGTISPGTRVVVAGFGITSINAQDVSDQVRFGKLKFSDFVGNYSLLSPDGPSVACSSGLGFDPEACIGTDPACSNVCPGDSGGPVYQFRPDSGWGVLAVNSGASCDAAKPVGGFSMIAADARTLRNWVLNE